MLFKSLSEAPPYQAPNHTGVDSVRLLGFEEGGPQQFWVGHSVVHPGGFAGPDRSPLEKVYVVLSGHLELHVDGQVHQLGPMDSCRIAPDEARLLRNTSTEPATLLVVMPYSVTT
jgi:quercetin dioxygenase-like cupin family protein